MAGPLIRSKTRVPAVADTVIERGRVVGTLERAACGRRVLQVVASAGSGKTTAVVQFIASRPGPQAWLTLGESDGSPGRFLTYLAAAMGGIDPVAPEQVPSMLARGVAPADCAALLAEGMPAGSTLVIDDLHLVESRPPVLMVLRALVEAVAPDALLVLVSRRMVHLNLSREVLTGRAGVVSGEDLSFTTGEVEELLTARGVVATPEVVSASGGWAAGIVFDALRGSGPPSGTPVDDPFFAYLGAEVLDTLPVELRQAVVSSSVLHTVDAAGLEALLLVPSGGALVRAIRSHHLPATVEPEGLRYHPRFREFLLSRLRDDPAEMRALLVRHARRLGALGQAEEAADHFIEAGAPDEAQPMVEAATPSVLMRGDWDKVLAWCDAIGEEALSHRPALRGCQLQAIIAGRRSEGPAFVERLRASGEYDRLVREHPDAATTAAFGLHLSMDWGTLLPLVPPGESSPGARALRYVLEVGSSRHPPQAWSPRDVERLSLNVGLFQCGLYFQGRFADVEYMAGINAGRDGDARSTELYRIATLRERGQLGEARSAFDAEAPYAAHGGFLDFWRHLEGELVFEEGDRERGLALVREARALTRRLGHRPADRAIFAFTEGKMLVRLGRVEEAIASLEATRTWCEEHGLPCFGEWADVWLAAAYLARGDDPAPAALLLEEAIDGMRTAGRSLELCAAWIVLAEARWRGGDAAGHHAAADAARAAAIGMGTMGQLLTLLQDRPEVLARRLASGGPGEETWRALAAAPPAAHPGDDPGRIRILLRTLGRPRAEVDGEELAIAPLRALEVAASVARAGDAGLARGALAEQVGDDSVDAPNYLRQLIHRLRRIAPEGVELVSDGDRLRWSPAGAVVTDDQLLEDLLARARQQVGPARRSTLAAALEIAEGGPLVAPGQGVADRRRRGELAAAVSEARREYAGLLLEAGRAQEALAVARTSVSDDPYREDGWRLLMRAAAAAAGASAAVPTYVECVEALEAIGLTPSDETRALLDRLRDPARTETAARR